MIEGKAVRNASSDLIISVTRLDMKEASPQDPGNCIVVHAIKRQLDCKQVYIRHGGIFILIGGSWFRFIASKSLRDLINKYDNHREFLFLLPGEFTLLAPKPQKSPKRFGRHHNPNVQLYVDHLYS